MSKQTTSATNNYISLPPARQDATQSMRLLSIVHIVDEIDELLDIHTSCVFVFKSIIKQRKTALDRKIEFLRDGATVAPAFIGIAKSTDF